MVLVMRMLVSVEVTNAIVLTTVNAAAGLEKAMDSEDDLAAVL